MSAGMIAINIIIFIVALILIVIIMLQDSKDDINDAFNGTKTDLFKNQKSRGIERVMKFVTAGVAVLFVLLVIIEFVIQVH